MAGTWHDLDHPRLGQFGEMSLLTDGSVYIEIFPPPLPDESWHPPPAACRLKPDAAGKYDNASLSMAPALPFPASDEGQSFGTSYACFRVLRSGKMLRVGMCNIRSGSISRKLKMYAGIFDPVESLWTALPLPDPWTELDISQTPRPPLLSCCELPDTGNVLVGVYRQEEKDLHTAVFVPSGSAGGWTSETRLTERGLGYWVLLRDGSVLSIEGSGGSFGRATHRFLPTSNEWHLQAPPPVFGPSVLLPDGKVLVVDSQGAGTALFTPPENIADKGQWTLEANLPEAPYALSAQLLPNGRVIVNALPLAGSPTPFQLLEYDGSKWTQVDFPREAFLTGSILLPTGELLVGNESLHIYSPDGEPISSCKPTILDVAARLEPRENTLTGTLFGGVSEGGRGVVGQHFSCGPATNYPLVRVREAKSGFVVYCRTYGQNTRALGAHATTTKFDIPDTVSGTAELVVIANGIASDPVRVSLPSRPSFEWPDDLFTSGPLRFLGSSDGGGFAYLPSGQIIKIPPCDPLGPTARVSAAMALYELARSLPPSERTKRVAREALSEAARSIKRALTMRATSGKSPGSDTPRVVKKTSGGSQGTAIRKGRK